MNELVPVYAQGVHVWSEDEVKLLILFEYLDRNRFYYNLINRGGEDLLNELTTLRTNMQKFLDEEVIRVNGMRVRPVVVDVAIGVRGTPSRSYVEYLVVFPFPLVKGLNTYENYYEEETAEYDYEILWILPSRARIVDVNIAGVYDLPLPNVLRVLVKRGTRVGGFEGFKFTI